MHIDKNKWYNKVEIMDIFPIGITTYKNRIRRLKNIKYSPYTKMITKSLVGSNLKKVEERLIHGSVLPELFGDIRLPNIYDKEKIGKWILNKNWEWFCNIVPCNSYPIELKSKMEFFHKKLKELLGCKSKIDIFYSIEENTNDPYYHCHFLIKSKPSILSVDQLIPLLEMTTEENNRKEKRIFVAPYDKGKYQNRGISYSNKKRSIDYGYLK